MKPSDVTISDRIERWKARRNTLLDQRESLDHEIRTAERIIQALAAARDPKLIATAVVNKTIAGGMRA